VETGLAVNVSPVIGGTVIVASENFEDLICLRADNGTDPRVHILQTKGVFFGGEVIHLPY